MAAPSRWREAARLDQNGRPRAHRSMTVGAVDDRLPLAALLALAMAWIAALEHAPALSERARHPRC